MNKIYGYARISRKEQSIDRQIRNITDVCPDVHLVQEAYTGRTMQRPEWDKLFSKVSNGDHLKEGAIIDALRCVLRPI